MKVIDNSRCDHSLCHPPSVVRITPDDSSGQNQMEAKQLSFLDGSMPPELSRSVRLLHPHELQNALGDNAQSLGTSSGGMYFVQIPVVWLCLVRPKCIPMMQSPLGEKWFATHGGVNPHIDFRAFYDFWRCLQHLNFYSEWLALYFGRWFTGSHSLITHSALRLVTCIIVWLLSHPSFPQNCAWYHKWLAVTTRRYWFLPGDEHSVFREPSFLSISG